MAEHTDGNQYNGIKEPLGNTAPEGEGNADTARVDTVSLIFDFLQSSGWVDVAHKEAVRFLAAGEYNENYLITTPDKEYVFRMNHGSQLGLGEDQIAYEFNILNELKDSGVTPIPYHLHRPDENLPGGAILMEFLDGRPLLYEMDTPLAARIFAKVHSVPVTSRADIIPQLTPVSDIADESIGLIERFPDHPLCEEKKVLLGYYESIRNLAEKADKDFSSEEQVIVNTEVNSGNFVIGDTKGFLIDWEKAVLSSRYQDLGHFLVSTTTRWKTDFVFSPQERLAFLKEYRVASNLDIALEEMDEKTSMMEQTILLRALSWCYMAFYEYTMSERAIRNASTFQRIKQYLDEIECILK